MSRSPNQDSLVSTSSLLAPQNVQRNDSGDVVAPPEENFLWESSDEEEEGEEMTVEESELRQVTAKIDMMDVDAGEGVGGEDIESPPKSPAPGTSGHWEGYRSQMNSPVDDATGDYHGDQDLELGSTNPSSPAQQGEEVPCEESVGSKRKRTEDAVAQSSSDEVTLTIPVVKNLKRKQGDDAKTAPSANEDALEAETPVPRNAVQGQRRLRKSSRKASSKSSLLTKRSGKVVRSDEDKDKDKDEGEDGDKDEDEDEDEDETKEDKEMKRASGQSRSRAKRIPKHQALTGSDYEDEVQEISSDESEGVKDVGEASGANKRKLKATAQQSSSLEPGEKLREKPCMPCMVAGRLCLEPPKVKDGKRSKTKSCKWCHDNKKRCSSSDIVQVDLAQGQLQENMENMAKTVGQLGKKVLGIEAAVAMLQKKVNSK